MKKQDKIKIYAKALSEIVIKNDYDEKKVIAGFVKILISEGLESQSDKILNLADKIIMSKQGRRTVVLETARPIKENQKKLFSGIVNKKDAIIEKINPELIAGIKIVIDDALQFDSSLKSKLQKIV